MNQFLGLALYVGGDIAATDGFLSGIRFGRDGS
jgi:hypothetical protein